MLRKLFAVGFVGVSFLLAGCGSGGSGGSSSTPPAMPVLSVAPSTTLTFASTVVGQTSATQSFTFSNSGTGTLTLGSYVLTGATSSFTQTTASTCGATASLAAGQSCTLVVAFVPQSAGALTETIAATDNTASPNVTLTLTGTGVAAALPPQATLSGTAIAFNPATVGSTTAAPGITLTNTGGSSLSLASITMGGVNLDQFAESNTCGSSLAAGATCTITASFVPTQVGSFTAVVTITDNAGGVANSMQTIALSGSSNGAIATLSPTSVTFAATTLNTAAGVQTVTLTNTGGAALTGVAGSITGGATASAFSIASTTCGSTLAAGAY